jgi:hypothetical protein
MLDGFGRYQGTWRPVSCIGHPEVFDGVPSLYVMQGSGVGWSAVQIRNPLTAVAEIGWKSLANPSVAGQLELLSGMENAYAIPSALLQTNENYLLTIMYTDETYSTVTVTSAQLATAAASYELQ